MPSLLASTKLALDRWLQNDWKNPNWYDNEIGVPRQMGNIGLLLQPALSFAESSKMEEIMSRADWKGSGTVANPKWTGANLLDMLRIQIHRGLFVNSTSLVQQGFARSFAAVAHKHQNEDSIMVDNSFHQHGPQLLAAAYGAVFTSDILDLACLSASTEFQMPAPAIDVFEGLVLDGQARMSRAGSWDWQVHGRGISIASGLEIGFSSDQMRNFADHVSPHRGDEWRSFAHRIEADDASASAALSGNRGFWSSDYMTHSQRDFLFTIHMFSARTIPAACVNEQGKLHSNVKLSVGGKIKLTLTDNWLCAQASLTDTSVMVAPRCIRLATSTTECFLAGTGRGLLVPRWRRRRHLRVAATLSIILLPRLWAPHRMEHMGLLFSSSLVDTRLLTPPRRPTTVASTAQSQEVSKTVGSVAWNRVGSVLATGAAAAKVVPKAAAAARSIIFVVAPLVPPAALMASSQDQHQDRTRMQTRRGCCSLTRLSRPAPLKFQSSEDW